MTPIPPAQAGEPADLVALYAVTDGIELADGTRILGQGEIEAATAWLKDERSLSWDDGPPGDRRARRSRHRPRSRSRGRPRRRRRAGGPDRRALDALAGGARRDPRYLEERLGITGAGPRAPEREARDAVARGDAQGIARAIARPFYPGAERELAHAALTLGALRAGAGDAEGALQAFAQAVAVSAQGARAAPRGGRSDFERGAGAAWKTCAVACREGRGAPGVGGGVPGPGERLDSALSKGKRAKSAGQKSDPDFCPLPFALCPLP